MGNVEVAQRFLWPVPQWWRISIAFAAVEQRPVKESMICSRDRIIRRSHMHPSHVSSMCDLLYTSISVRTEKW